MKAKINFKQRVELCNSFAIHEASLSYAWTFDPVDRHLPICGRNNTGWPHIEDLFDVSKDKP